jgi:cysteine desulfurase / selenocysteine lyase
VVAMTEYRKDFPILSSPLSYLDSAATSQRPASVVRAVSDYYLKMNANVHRGVYQWSHLATEAFESTRRKVAQFLGAESTREVIFTKGTTDSINIVAQTFGENLIREGDVIAVTRMEHHANFIPWQQLAIRKKARFEIIELTEDLRLDPADVDRVLKLKPKILAVTLMSNVTGVRNHVAELAQRFNSAGCAVVLDAAQGLAHEQLLLKNLGPIDFLALSAHKLLGPTGVGVLWGRESLLEVMPPAQFGGQMIQEVFDQNSTWNELPHKFEAGTPDIAGVIGFGEAIDYLERVGRHNIQEYEEQITTLVLREIALIPGVQLFGPRTAVNRGPVFSFSVSGVHAHDLATYFDLKGIAVRAGHHCAQPLMSHIGASSTCRASFSFYNTLEEAEGFLTALREAATFFERKRRPPEKRSS